jgi:hypothetical protein
MTTLRDAVLQGSLEAAQLHADAGLGGGLGGGTAPIDVYRFISERQITLLFQKLGGLLGAYLEVQRPGILVTTERPLAIQRFTAVLKVRLKSLFELYIIGMLNHVRKPLNDLVFRGEEIAELCAVKSLQARKVIGGYESHFENLVVVCVR